MHPWTRENRGLLVYTAGVLLLTVCLGLLYFLFGHQLLSGDGEWLASRAAAMAGEAGGSPESALAAADGLAQYVLFALAGLLIVPAWWLRRPGLPPKEVVDRALAFLFVAALYLCIAQISVFSSYRSPGFHCWDPGSWDKTLTMTGVRRNSTRVLSPWLVRSLTRLIPAPRREELRRVAMASPFVAQLTEKAEGTQGYELELAVSVVVALTFHLLAMVAIGALARTLYEAPALHHRVIIPLCFSLFLPTLFKNCTFVYDMTNLCFITVGYLLLARRRLVLFHLFYALALLNKESFVLTSVVFLVLMWDRLPWRVYLGCLVLQGVTFLGLGRILAMVFGNTPGTFLQNWLGQNLGWIVRNNVWFFLTEIDRTAYWFPLAYLPFFLFLAVFRWREKHPVLRRMFVPAFIVLTLVNLSMVVFDEWRDFYEVYPLVVLLAYETIAAIFDRSAHRPVLLDRSQDSAALCLSRLRGSRRE